MANFYDLIDTIAKHNKGETKGMMLANFVIGTVRNRYPIQIDIGSEIMLTEAYLGFTGQVANAKNKHEPLNHKLEIGDKVLLGKMTGGQQYIVIDLVRGVFIDDTEN